MHSPTRYRHVATADFWVCRVGTLANMFLHHMSWPLHFMSVFLDLWPTCRHPTFPTKIVEEI